MSEENESYDSDGDKSFSIKNNNEVPGIINYTTLKRLIVEQAPKGERGKLIDKSDIHLDEIDDIQIEFLSILKIDLLWTMPNLVKLTLSHNKIEKIENLDELIKLKELNLSFNQIKIMENLDHLVALENLFLTGNRIADIKGIDNLKRLEIFSIANNNIQTCDHAVYLRRFKRLRSLNITGNPCTEKENYNNYLIAFLPQVIYLSYMLIKEEQRAIISQTYRRDLIKIEEEELKANNDLDKDRMLNQKAENDFICFVEHLNGEEFFNMLFLHDKDGLILKTINDETLVVFEDYKNNFIKTYQDLYEFGINEYQYRLEEIKEFSGGIENARLDVQKKSKQIIDVILEKRREAITNFKSLTNHESDDILNKELPMDQDHIVINEIIKAQEFVDEFNDFLSDMWSQLLENQIVFHEQFEDIIEVFRNDMTDIKEILLEFARNSFTQMRNILVQYRDNINRAASIYISDESSMPKHLKDICGDMNTFNDILSTSYDIHLQAIDAREDTMINRVNSWLEKLIDDFIDEENMKYRHGLVEISHFLEYHRDQIYKDLLGSNQIAIDVAAVLEDT